jgi:hypothetical protein
MRFTAQHHRKQNQQTPKLIFFDFDESITKIPILAITKLFYDS